MTDSYLELDPDGDVVLILKSAPFIPEEIVETVDEPTVGEPAAGTTEEPSIGTNPGTQISSVQTDEKSLDQPFRIRVSSKHLILASPVFKAFLQTRFKEGQQLSSHGYTELPLPDDNPAALLVLLNLIHGKFRKVSRTTNLSTLTELAILVDKYELWETTEMLLDYWFQDLESNEPFGLTDDLLSLICISWVFQRPTLFKEVTKRAQLESKGILERNQLPIPESVLKKIEQFRQTVLAEIFEYLQSILKKYRGSERICPQGMECDGMILGSLTIGLNALDILQPPLPPYDGFSVKTLFQNLARMEVPQYCQTQHRRHYGSHLTCQGVERHLKAKLEEIEQQLQGLDLTDAHKS